MAQSVIGALRINLGIDSAQFSKGLKGAEGGLARLSKQAKVVGAAIGAALGTAAVGVGLAIRGAINAADEMSKASQKFGVPIEELSRLKYAADLSGVSFDGLGTSLRRLSQNMNDAANGTGEGLKAFEQLGVSVKNSDGTLKSSSAILTELSDKFAAMPDGAEKTALAMDLMGRSGADMIPLLNGGSAALQKLLSEADQFGQVFTAEMGQQAEAFNDNISRLTGTFASIAAGIARDLLPHLERFSQWLVDNSPAIRAFVTGVVEALVQFGQGAAQTKAEIEAIIQAFQDFVAALRAIPAQMRQIGQDIIDGLVNGIRQRWESVKSTVTGFASDLVDGVKSTLGIQSPSSVMREIGVNIMQGLGEGVESMKDTIGDLAQQIGQTVMSAFSGIIEGTKSIKEAIGEVLRELGKLLVNQGFQMLFGGVGGTGGLFGGIGKLLGFAHGGSFTVGGSGGIDSQLVAFRATPGEQVDVRRPGQQRDGIGELRISVDVDRSGNIIPIVRDVAGNVVAQAAPSIVGAATRQTKRNFPSMAADAQLRVG